MTRLEFSYPEIGMRAITTVDTVPGWANRTLSEVEEQVERTWMQHRTPVAALLVLLFVLLFSVLALLVQFNSGRAPTLAARGGTTFS